MSITYYNLPEFPKFLPIVETIANGRVHSFVSKIDYDMNLDTSNWNHLVTTNAIKSYIDNKVSELESQNYLFEDYFIINDTILDTSSGAVISDNITNILYPNSSTTVKFNTSTADIKFDSEDIKLTIPRNTNKEVNGFKYKSNTPQTNLLSNEDFTYPLTWNQLDNYSDISITGLHLQANESVSYKLPCDKAIPVQVSLENTGIVNYSVSNGVLTLTNSNTQNDVSSIEVKETNIIDKSEAKETLNSFYDVANHEFNSYWDMYTLSSKRQDFNNMVSHGPTHCESIQSGADTLYVYRMNPVTRVSSEDIISYGTNNIIVSFQIKVSSENANFYVREEGTDKEPQHVASFGGADLYIFNDGLGENFYFEYELGNRLSYPITYDEYHTVKYEYKQGELSIYVDGSIIYNRSIQVTLNDSRIVFGAMGKFPGFYGELVVGKDVNNLPRSLVTANEWTWNTILLNKETRYETLDIDQDYIINTNLITPVFDPDNSKWIFDIDLLIDKDLAPSSFDIVSTGTSCFDGINIRYNKSQNVVEIKVNSKEACYSSDNRKGFPTPISNSSLSCKSILTQTGKCKVKIEFTGYSYNVYAGEVETRKIGELRTSTPIEPSYFRINACTGVYINKNTSYITLEDSIWWSFYTLNYTEDYQYCNLEVSNNVSVVNNEIIPVSNQIVRIPYSRTDGATAEITFIPTSYVADNNVIISSLLYSSDGILIYQKNDTSIYVKANKNASEVILGQYELNKKYHIRIVDKVSRYEITLLDENYRPINKLENIANNKSIYMTGLMLGSSTSTSVASGIKFLLDESYSDNFVWNFIQPKSFILYGGTKLFEPVAKGVAITSYSFNERYVGFDTQINDIRNNIFYRHSNTSLLQPSPIIPVKIHIINNKSRSTNVAYLDIALNNFIINNITEYGVPVGGLYESYEVEGINHYIYPRHINNIKKDFGGLKVKYLETGSKYEFSYSDSVYDSSYQYKIGSELTETISKNDSEGSIEVNPIFDQNDYIRIIGNGKLISTSRLLNTEMNRLSCISNGDLLDNNWMYKKENNNEKYSYYSNIENKDYAIVVGSVLNSTDKIYSTSNFFEKYEINQNNVSNSIVATRNDINELNKTRLVNPNNMSKLYSVDLLQNYIKSGDFSVLTDWKFTCRNYYIIRVGYLTINNATFDLYQNILEMQDEEVSRYLVNVGEELLLTFTISDFESGKVIVDYGTNTQTYYNNGTYSVAFKVLSKEQKIRFYSDDAETKLSLSNISLISLNKIANPTFQNPTYWQFEDYSIFTNNGITLTDSQFIGQNIYLREWKEYIGTIKIDEITGKLFAYVNDEKVATFNTNGIHTFNIVSNTNEANIRIEKDLGDGVAKISYVNVREKSYISDSKLEGMINSWNYDCDNVYIENHKLIIDGGEAKEVSSSNIVPNTQYKLSFNLNILHGTFDLYVGDERNNKFLKSFNVLDNGENELTFLSNNSSDCRLWIVASIDTKLSIEAVKLELLNYIIDFSDIAYNWQTNVDTISIIDNNINFNNVESNGRIFQYNSQLVPANEYTVQIKANVTSGELKLYYGSTEVGTITNGLNDYTGIMDSSKNINIIASQNNTSAKVEVFSLMKKLNNFTLDAEASILGTARNLSLTEINLSTSLSGFEYYDGKLIGLKIGNVFATGYLNIKDSRIENINRSKEYFKINLGDTDVVINANNTVELLEPNYIFIDNNGNIKVTSKVEYGKYRKEISLGAEVWYNLIDKTYYTNNNEMVYLIGKAFVNENSVVFTENIQKQRKLLSYTKPYIKDNILRKSEKGLYDISTLFFNGTSRTLFDTTKPYGKYIVYRNITSSSNPYNLDINSLYVDYDSNHINKSASWNSDRNMFVSPYTLDEAICEIHHSDSGQKYYDLTREYDIIEEAGTYDRLTYKNPDHSVVIELPDGTKQSVTISTLSSTSQAVGTKVYWRN